MKMFVKKLKVLVAFLSNQKIGGGGTRLPPSLLFSQNLPIKTMRNPFSQKKLVWKFRFNYLCAESQDQNMHYFKNVQKLNKRNKFLF